MSKSRPSSSVLRTVVTGALLFACFAIAGYYSTWCISETVLTPLLKYAIGVVGVVWFFSLTVYNKLSDLTDLPGLDFRQHRNVEVEIRSRLQWFWLRAIFLGLLALTMYVPTILHESKLVTPAWVVGTAFGALAMALFSLRRLWAELEEIRELKSYVKEIERRAKERVEQVKELKEGHKEEWKADPQLNSFRGNDSKEHGK